MSRTSCLTIILYWLSLRLRSAPLKVNDVLPLVLSVAATAAESKHTEIDSHHLDSVLHRVDWREMMRLENSLPFRG